MDADFSGSVTTDSATGGAKTPGAFSRSTGPSRRCIARTLTAIPGVLIGLLAMSVSSPALAEDSNATKTAAPKNTQTAEAKTSDGIRRDPKGKTGISPMWEAISKGDSAYLARDLDEAVKQYREAVKHDRENPLPYTRLAGALRAKTEFSEAVDVLNTGLRFANTVTMRARIMFLQSDILERQKEFEAALKRWQEYQKLASTGDKGELKGAVLYPETAKERIKQLQATIKRNKEYAAVKERIQKREAELDAKATGKKK